jgi:hypothetical protein
VPVTVTFPNKAEIMLAKVACKPVVVVVAFTFSVVVVDLVVETPCGAIFEPFTTLKTVEVDTVPEPPPPDISANEVYIKNAPAKINTKVIFKIMWLVLLIYLFRSDKYQ